MKSWSTASWRRLLVIRVAGLGLLLPGLALAQTRTWDNDAGTNLWGSATNWSGNTLPAAAGIAQFTGTDSDGSPSVVNNIELQANQTVGSLSFSGANDNFSLINGSGSRTLTLTTGDISRSALSTKVQTLAFTTLALGADSAMSIQATATPGFANGLVITSNIIDSVFGANHTLTKTGSSELTLSGNNTYGGATTLNGGTLTLASSSALGASGTLTIASGTLKLSTATTSLTTLNITGNSTIDFGGADATLSVTNLTISAGVTLNVINWTNAMDFFFAANWTGAVFNTTGSNPMNQVVFSTPTNSPVYTGNDTKWLIYGSHEITPVPEPSTYGAVVLAATTGLVYWRRRRVSRLAA